MRAAVALGEGVVDLAEREVPLAGADGVVVRIGAAACNRADLLTASGFFGTIPLTLGIDGAGVVEEVGREVARVRPGDRVILNPVVSCGRCAFCADGQDGLCSTRRCLGQTADGTFADFVVVPEGNAHRLEDHVSMTTAAALATPLYTSWHVLVTRARVRPGETVLITAGGSGVGSVAVQLAKRWGLRVVTTAGSAEKRRRLATLGADLAVDHGEEGWADLVLDGVGQVDVVIDLVGSVFWPDYARCLRPGGRVIAMSLTTGKRAAVDLGELLGRQLSILGSGQQGAKPEVREAVALLNSGLVSPVIDSIHAFPDVASAHARLRDRSAFGRVLLGVDTADIAGSAKDASHSQHPPTTEGVST
jgi:NADPH:quinone reductase-like Zn-dependent oxidoreductase